MMDPEITFISCVSLLLILALFATAELVLNIFNYFKRNFWRERK